MKLKLESRENQWNPKLLFFLRQKKKNDKDLAGLIEKKDREEMNY